MMHLVGLLEDGGRELLLALTESVNVCRACVHGLGHASLGLPVGHRAEGVALGLPIIVDRRALHIPAPKDTRLELLILLFATVDALVDIHPSGLVFVRAGGLGVLPVGSR